MLMASWACSALARDRGGQLSREHVTDALRAAGIGVNGELTDLLWTEMGLEQNAPITKVSVWLLEIATDKSVRSCSPLLKAVQALFRMSTIHTASAFFYILKTPQHMQAEVACCRLGPSQPAYLAHLLEMLCRTHGRG